MNELNLIEKIKCDFIIGVASDDKLLEYVSWTSLTNLYTKGKLKSVELHELLYLVGYKEQIQ